MDGHHHDSGPVPAADEVLAVVSHEIRAPLTVISGYLEILEGPVDESSRAVALKHSRRAIERIEVLLDDLETATSAAECLAPRAWSPVSMAALAEEMVSALEHARTHHLAVETASRGRVSGDPVRLRQALGNILGNAIVHTPQGGGVTVRVERRGDTVLTTVNDEGPGIPEACREAVFERFVRCAEGDNAPRGAGLGLYIVKAIAEAHGGSVRAEAGEGGRGARLVMELPAADTSAGRAADAS